LVFSFWVRVLHCFFILSLVQAWLFLFTHHDCNAAVSFLLTVLIGAESIKSLFTFFQTGKLTMDSLFAISTITLIGASVLLFSCPGYHDV